MRRNRQIRIWLAALAVAALTGCVEEGPYDYDDVYPPPPYGYYAYDYYPDVEVYYYPARHVYWWNDHGHWRSGRRVPPNIELHEHVRVNINSREPWRHHDEIRRRYPSPAHEVHRPPAAHREGAGPVGPGPEPGGGEGPRQR